MMLTDLQTELQRWSAFVDYRDHRNLVSDLVVSKVLSTPYQTHNRKLLQHKHRITKWLNTSKAFVYNVTSNTCIPV